jgi:hypothetical protein
MCTHICGTFVIRTNKRIVPYLLKTNSIPLYKEVEKKEILKKTKKKGTKKKGEKIIIFYLFIVPKKQNLIGFFHK